MGKEKKDKISETDAEKLLGAWMAMAIGIRGNRILKTLSFNEMVICRLLYQARLENRRITATDICRETRLLKSQVNKVLNDMEKNGMICRQRDEGDKRRVFLLMKEESEEIYLTEHARVMAIVKQVSERLGENEVEALIDKMNKVVAVMDEIMP